MRMQVHSRDTAPEDVQMRPSLTMAPKLAPGDRVAVVSPSFAAPGRFPHVHEQAMRRLREDIGLAPVEYPTTRRLGAPPQARAADLMAAFADTSIRAIMATIGGEDQITVLPFLDPELVTANPKPFFGYSDNTNLHNWLWNLGIASYHGGSTMVHLGRAGGLHPVSARSLCAALFENGELDLHPVDAFSDEELSWEDPANLNIENPTRTSPGWSWHRPNRVVTAPTWGGNLEILHWNLAAGRWIRPVEDYAGCVFLVETSEELPSHLEVFRMLRNAGERGLLSQFPAVLVGAPKATSLEHHHGLEERSQYEAAQRDAVLRAFATYNPEAMIVFGVDIGHTDPQWVLPHGGRITVDGPGRRIVASYAPGPVAAA
jgi:muramoyltetrapeptide carboxypeptidase LdcA involved in peptidoglycan recycling